MKPITIGILAGIKIFIASVLIAVFKHQGESEFLVNVFVEGLMPGVAFGVVWFLVVWGIFRVEKFVLGSSFHTPYTFIKYIGIYPFAIFVVITYLSELFHFGINGRVVRGFPFQYLVSGECETCVAHFFPENLLYNILVYMVISGIIWVIFHENSLVESSKE